MLAELSCSIWREGRCASASYGARARGAGVPAPLRVSVLRIHAVQLHRARQELELTGARLAVIGQGTPAHAADFRRRQGIDIPILVDPDRASYSAAGAKIGTLSEVLGPRVMLTGVRHGRPLGLRLGKTDGGLGQLGGVLIVSPEGSIPYS